MLYFIIMSIVLAVFVYYLADYCGFFINENDEPPQLLTNQPSVTNSQTTSVQNNYDPLYDDVDGETDVDNVVNESLIKHLLGQVSFGMDLTKVQLPTFILEKRSLLEMYADFFAHPDIFIEIADKQNPKDRMVQVVLWYLTSFHAGRKSMSAKKPYNPILGETFSCVWDVETSKRRRSSLGGGKSFKSDGPVPWCKENQLAFIAEQVSHHPPISAFYAEHVKKKIQFNGYIHTKSKFLGLSICVYNLGEGIISFLDINEHYAVTFPAAYGRSILTVPWIELGGPVTIKCPETGYLCRIEFITKAFYSQIKHKINADVFEPLQKVPFLNISGAWNGAMEAVWDGGTKQRFTNVADLHIHEKHVKPVSEQKNNESRRLWKDVTAALKFKNIEAATHAKSILENKQREDAKVRKEQNEIWETVHFDKTTDDKWVYKMPLNVRQK